MNQSHPTVQQPPRARAEPHGAWRPTVLREHHAPVSAIAFSRDGRRLASLGEDGEILVWDLTLGRAVVRLASHLHQPRAICFFGFEGRTLVAGGQDGYLRVWDLEHKHSLHKTAMPDGRRVLDLACSSCGKFLAVTAGFPGVPAEGDHLVQIRHADDPSAPPLWTDHSAGFPRFTTWEGTVALVTSHATSTGAETFRVTGVEAQTGRALWGLATSAPLVAASEFGTLALYRDGELSLALPHRHVGMLFRIDLSHAAFVNGGELLAACGGGRVYLFDSATGQHLATGEQPESIAALAIGASGPTLATAGHDRAVRLWSLEAWSPASRTAAPRGP